MKNQEEVTKAFTPVEKLGQHPQFLIMSITNSYKELASEIVQNVPESLDRFAALRKLLEAKHMTIQAISHGDYSEALEPQKHVEQKEKKDEKAKDKKQA